MNEQSNTSALAKYSVIIKLLLIGLLALLLLIPANMIQFIIQERESLNQEAITYPFCRLVNPLPLS